MGMLEYFLEVPEEEAQYILTKKQDAEASIGAAVAQAMRDADVWRDCGASVVTLAPEGKRLEVRRHHCRLRVQYLKQDGTWGELAPRS